MITAPQIITQRTKTGLEVWLSKSYLFDKCDGLSDGYLRVAMARKKAGRGVSWRSQKMDNETYFEYTSIPKGKYYEMLPTRTELIELANQPATTTGTTLELEAKQFIGNGFAKYLTYYNSQCTAQQAINLARACAMLEWMIKHIDDVSLDLSKMDFFKTAGEIIGALEIKYLPEAHRNLKYKVLEILSGNASIIESVSLPRTGNDYAAANREDKEVLGWIYELRESGANYTNAFIIRKVQTECEKVGKPAPSDRWIGEILERHETKFLTASTRFGAKGKYGNPYKTSIPTANALFAGDCWEVDGTRVNMLPHKNADGKNVYLYVIAVRDVHSGNAVGLNFDVSENRWSVTQAISNAVRNTGYLPYEIRIDRFPGYNSPEAQTMLETMKMLGVKITMVYKSTGKQRLERWFGTMQHIALQESPFYYGEGVLSHRKTAHRSIEFMKSAQKMAKEAGWDFNAAVNHAEQCINTWLATPYSKWSRKYAHIELSPAQLHEQSQKPNIISCTVKQHAYLFGLRKELQIKNNGLIKTTINHEEFTYQIEDYEVIKKYDRVVCCYDVEDLSKVHIYAPGKEAVKRYLGCAKEFVPIQTYGPDSDFKRLGKIKAMYSEFDNQKQADIAQIKVANGNNFDLGAAYSAVAPMTVGKALQEAAETAATDEYFGFDDGNNLRVDVTNQL